MRQVGCAAAFIFLELFAGQGNLSKSLATSSAGKVQVRDPRDSRHGWDIAEDEAFLDALENCRSVDWLHAAPPCTRFSKARRQDNSTRNGWVDLKWRADPRRDRERDKSAQSIAERTAELALQQLEAGRWFSIENPWDSTIWDLKCMRRLAKLPGVRFVRLDQCTVGSEHFKPTAILTNAPWLQDRTCDMATRPHVHVPLVGFVKDYRSEKDRTCFLTELAAEYPQDMCLWWATCLREWLEAREPAAPPITRRLHDSTPAPRDPPPKGYAVLGRFANSLIKTSLWSRAQHGPLMRGTVLRTAREHRADQDSEAVGGLRNPNNAVARSAGLRWVGARIRTVLEKAFEDKDVLAAALEAVDKMDDSTHQGHPAVTVAKVSEAHCAEFLTSLDADAGGNRSQYHSKFLERQPLRRQQPLRLRMRRQPLRRQPLRRPRQRPPRRRRPLRRQPRRQPHRRPRRQPKATMIPGLALAPTATAP